MNACLHSSAPQALLASVFADTMLLSIFPSSLALGSMRLSMMLSFSLEAIYRRVNKLANGTAAPQVITAFGYECHFGAALNTLFDGIIVTLLVYLCLDLGSFLASAGVLLVEQRVFATASAAVCFLGALIAV